LAAFIDGRLSAAERDRLETHLAGCGRCLAALGDALRVESAPLPSVPQGRLARLADTVIAAQGARLSLPGWIAVAATLAVASSAGFLLGARTMRDVAAVSRAADLPFDLSPLVSAP
jgi:hypothetical protein